MTRPAPDASPQSSIPPGLLAAARAARGFMPDDEGAFLHRYAAIAAPHGALLEVGSYCGKSTIYLGAAAQRAAGTVFAVDHHRGSEENQAGWEHHDPTLVDPAVGLMDTLPVFRYAIHDAGLEDVVVAVVGSSATVGRHWRTPLALLFIDGGHGADPAHTDYETWAPWVAHDALLLIHDVFPDPADGGRPPYEVYLRALEDGFIEIDQQGSMRALRRTDGAAGDAVGSRP